MKKILLLLFLLLVIALGVYFGASAFKELPVVGPAVESYQEAVDDLLGKDRVVLEEEESPEKEPEEEPEEETEEQVESELEEEPEEEPIEEEPEETGVEVPELINLGFYEDERVNFTYPAGMSVVKASDLTIELRDAEGKLAAYFDFFENPENKNLDSFLQSDNVIDYLSEAVRMDVEVRSLTVGDESIYLQDYPGLIEQDIYLIRIPDYVIIVQARSDKELIRKYVAPTLEAR